MLSPYSKEGVETSADRKETPKESRRVTYKRKSKPSDGIPLFVLLFRKRRVKTIIAPRNFGVDCSGDHESEDLVCPDPLDTDGGENPVSGSTL